LEEARDGRVCPAARDVYELPNVEAQRHAEALHAAILADAECLPGFAELVRWDAASRHTGALPASMRLGLLAAPSPDPAIHDSAKEVVHVFPSRTD
jgi:hypothetical protein